MKRKAYVRGCPTNKRSYDTRTAAEEALAKAQLRIRGGKIPIRVYQCDCGFWHTTSTPLKEHKHV